MPCTRCVLMRQGERSGVFTNCRVGVGNPSRWHCLWQHRPTECSLNPISVRLITPEPPLSPLAAPGSREESRTLQNPRKDQPFGIQTRITSKYI